MTALKRHHRYPGARPFTGDLEDQRLFFGRHDETNDLFHRIRASRLLVLFGKSGIGKTSLLQAGVLPRLREVDFLPLTIRLNQKVSSVVDYFIAAIEAQCDKESIYYVPGESGSLWEFFKTVVFWQGNRLLRPILVFDQFEEIFTLQDTKSRKLIARNLGQLFSERIPASVRERFGADAINTYREQAPNLKVILCLRDEFIGNLQALVADMPGILDDRFRLVPLQADTARKAVVEPALLPQNDVFVTPKFQYTDESVNNLLQFLTGESDEAEPFQLQVLCHYVERQVAERSGDGPIIVSEDYLGDRQRMQQVLQNFYVDAVNQLPSKKQRRRARELCEEGLLSSHGRRLSLEQNQITQQFKIDEASLNALVDARVLRREARLQSYYYELSHDSLAGSIADNKSWRMPKWLIAVMATIATLMVLFGVLYLVTLEQRQKAEVAAVEAQQARQEAERILNFLTFNLRDKLEPIGRLDVVEDVHSVVDDYYRRMGVESSDVDGINRRSANHMHYGDLLRSRGNLNGALKEYQEAMRLSKKIVDMEPDVASWERELTVRYNRVGDIQKDRGRLDEALDAYEESLRIRMRLANSDSTNVGWQRDLSVSYDRIGDIQQVRGYLNEAVEAYYKGLTISERLANSDSTNVGWQRDLSVSYERIGDIQRVRGDLDEALKAHKKGLTIRERLANADPKNAGWQRDLSVSFDRIGDIQQVRGSFDEALESYGKGLAISERLANADPTNAGWQHDLFMSYSKIGEIQRVRGHLDQALEAYKKGLTIRERLARADPKNAGWQRDLSVSFDRIGEIQHDRGYLDEALEAYKKGLKIRERLADADPTNLMWQSDLSGSFLKIGKIFFEKKNSIKAIARYRSSLEITERLLRLDPTNLSWKLTYVESLWRLADSLDTTQESTRAEAINNLTTAQNILRKLDSENLLIYDEKDWLDQIEKQLNNLESD